MKKAIFLCIFQLFSFVMFAQINTDRVMTIGQNALYFEDYILSIQYFNQVIKSKPWLAEPYFLRAIAKINLDDYKGAEEDCSMCIERNPFMVQAYYARGIARQNLENYDGAIQDYNKGLEFKADDRQMMVNKAVACIQKKDFKEAENVFETLMKEYPKYSMNYLTRGAMYSELGDTAKALDDYTTAIQMDPYYAPGYGNRGIIYYQKGELDKALADFNDAIKLNTRESGYYINRGLVRYQQNNLRGAMEDYDQVVNMDSHNLIARFNRGLLRAQIGDNNRAIEDFDMVLDMEPDNFMAIYNRAILRYQTGDYRGSINDLDKVLTQYPNFIAGYYTRSDAKRKNHDAAGADRDQWQAFNLDQSRKKGNVNNNATASNTADATTPDKKEENTREQSDNSIDKFNRLVVYDKEEERKTKYNSDIRGRVQDKNVKVDLEPMFVVTFYEKLNQVKNQIYYDKMVENYNSKLLLSHKLKLTNEEAALTEDQIKIHFASIDNLAAKIEHNPKDANIYFGRALDFMLVQDFSEAIKDYTKVIELAPDFAMAYFNRANVRYKQMEYNQAHNASTQDDEVMKMDLNIGSTSSTPSPSTSDPVTGALKDNKRAYEHEMISRDYDMVIKLNPEFVYAYFNRGNLRCVQRDFRAAIQDYSEAINRNPEFAEAYFNRGLARLSQGDAPGGIGDLSKAGELGIISAYNIIKRMTVN